MTPFGIRKKLKALLGRSKPKPPPRPARPSYPVLFETSAGESYSVDAKEGDSLVLASGRGAWPIATGCADGTCATCQVEVLEGEESLSQADSYENDTKKENNVAEHLRLGCQAAVLGVGLRVRIINVLGEDLAE